MYPSVINICQPKNLKSLGPEVFVGGSNSESNSGINLLERDQSKTCQKTLKISKKTDMQSKTD
jgi:hypothetical protein